MILQADHVVVVANLRSHLVGETPESCKFLRFFILHHVVDAVAVFVVDGDCEKTEAVSIETHSEDHDEALDAVLQVSPRVVIAEAKACHARDYEEHRVYVLLNLWHSMLIVQDKGCPDEVFLGVYSRQEQPEAGEEVSHHEDEKECLESSNVGLLASSHIREIEV